MNNPYNQPIPTQSFVQRRVILLPNGDQVPLQATSERTILLPDGQRLTEVTTAFTLTPEGVLLQEPSNHVLYQCGSCGAQPLLVALPCARCGRATCTPCVELIDDQLVCRSCAHRSLWQLLISLFTDLRWLKPQ